MKIKKSFLLVSVLFFLVCCTSKDLGEADDNSYEDEYENPGQETSPEEKINPGLWTQYSDMQGTPRYGASSFTINNKGYVVGGYDMNSKTVADVWIYDMDKYSWDKGDEFPGITRQYAVGTSCNGKGYYGLGYYPDYHDGITLDEYDTGKEIILYNETQGRLWDWWQYDPNGLTGNKWKRLPDFPGEARSHAIVFTIGNKVYAGTGEKKQQGIVSDIYEFDTVSNTWNIAPIEFPHSVKSASCFVIDDIAYIMGGYNNTYKYQFYSFNPDRSPKWIRLRDIDNTSDEEYDDNYTILRVNACTFVIDDFGFITCGNSGSLRTDTWKYDPATDLWEKMNFFKGSSRELAVSFSTGKKEGAFIVTGRSSSSNYFDDLWNFNPYEWDKN